MRNPIKQHDEDFARIRSRRLQLERKSQGLTRPAWARSERCWDVRSRAAGRLSTVYSTGRGSGCAGECERGIVFGGSGNGEAMVANKVHGVRCALCWNLESARLSRQHNDANVLSLGERLIEEISRWKLCRSGWMTEFEGGRHAARVAMLNAM